MSIGIHWYRHGLRLHDNPALVEAAKKTNKLITLYIFDGKIEGDQQIGYNRMRFLLESLKDLDDNLKLRGGCLYILQGNPVDIFEKIKNEVGLNLISFEQDCEPIWKKRDDAVKRFSRENNIECIEKVSHTLWDPKLIIQNNGGVAPLTFENFLSITSKIGNPPRPVPHVDWLSVNFAELPTSVLKKFKALNNPSPEYFNMYPEVPEIHSSHNRLYGGETKALEQLMVRLEFEKEAFINGFYLPNQVNPDLLGPPSSMSAALRLGCLSIRKFYWELSKLFMQTFEEDLLPQHSATSQLIWRDYFYVMSVDNDQFDQIENNPACIKIPWGDLELEKNRMHLNCWKYGKTGYPFIDAGMRQLLQEGWIHHVVRNSVACFLTRGDLWISWTEGFKHFIKFLLDGDWAVCSGNWIWVSSSTFEQILDCPLCVCPVSYGKRLDPTGEYVRRYVPELRKLPDKYLFEPWKCPIEIQKKVGCIIGKDYPHRIVDHQNASCENRKKMQELRSSLMNENSIPHCRPSNTTELKKFMYLSNDCMEELCMNLHSEYSNIY
ncbi:cryptochrome-1 [Daktulosphaira vitifoliae]|uniref:cryptochrome-1 n=1 Tax=Daktulosphaira vitifoliae TaxID=58002 RepID=UPI0021AA743B|nr:cryptochrome-1 [Daktulosphaira vitifoliae]XP_050537924.1 cryptochrome-1 [Daktulosphaira vitifoliae]XP_050537925.1 cryptochrome-1 [Daktulosphaira vitifoliae]XP_050537926.1 cryptochrome-1 [Daktulosphaira vitifoliae]XP_050537927.1 cryptochrome-1 [Daktulosphaira vitifoliae]